MDVELFGTLRILSFFRVFTVQCYRVYGVGLKQLTKILYVICYVLC